MGKAVTMSNYADKYVESYVLPVLAARVDDYKRVAGDMARLWKDHGALEYVECIADDVRPGKITSFPQAVDLKPGEIVAFSWILYRSREHRDEVMAKVMADPRMTGMDKSAMPVDGMRMFWGGFKVFLAT